MSATLTLPSVPIELFTLDNGLRVVMSEEHSVPVVSIAVYYDVGSRNERPGRTGFAHLFEHMMFQGSENVPKSAHFQYIFKSGGTLNGTTSTERTNYFESLPAHQLPLGLWLESDRMRSLKVTQENLDNQREAVKEEKRLTYDNRPYSNALLRLNELIYHNPANAHSTIGSMEDLDAAALEEFQEFYRTYYAPNNAVLSIVGDFDPQEARELVEKYFGSIPRQPAPPPVDVSEPLYVARQHEVYHDRFAQFPALIMGWKAPSRRSEDYYALGLASDLLLHGDSSRFYQRLVKGDESVMAIEGGTNDRRGPSSFYLFGIPKPGFELKQIQDTILEEIHRLAVNEPSQEEMEKLRNMLLNDSVRGRQSSLYRAQRLAEYTLYDGDPNLFNTELERYLNVTAREISGVTARYLDIDKYTVLEVIPSPEAQAAEGVSPSDVEASDAEQPGAPPPQVPPKPPAQTAMPTEPPLPVEHAAGENELPQPSAEAPTVKA